MLREVLRSTLYSSRRPFSSNATRRSSFSALMTILFPVLRDERPKIFRTFSNIIKLTEWVGLHRMHKRNAIHHWRNYFTGAGSAAEEGLGLVLDANQKVAQRSLVY